MLELARSTTVVGEDRCAVAVLVAVDEGEGVVVAGGAHDAQHRSEDLFPVDAHRRLDVVDQTGPEEEAVFVALDLEAAAVDDDFGARFFALADVVSDAVSVGARDQRTHLRFRIKTVADLHRRDAFLNLWQQLVGGVADGDEDRNRHAAFAGRAEAAADGRVGSEVHVGVGQDHHVVLRAAEGLHALAMLRRVFVDVAGDRRAADEADRGNIRVLDQAIDRDLVAVHDVEHAGGQARFGEELGAEHRDRGIALAGLEHEGVPAGDGHRVHPHRHHRREVERRDASDDADGLTQ